MKTRRSPLAFIAVSLLVALTGGLLSGGGAVAATTSLTIQVGGTVDGHPESVYISGLVEVTSTLVTDPDFGAAPKVILAFDLHDLTGHGLSTSTRYVSNAQEKVIRRLGSSDVVEITFPFYPSGTTGLSARSGLASFTLVFDTLTGALVEGSASVGTPGF